MDMLIAPASVRRIPLLARLLAKLYTWRERLARRRRLAQWRKGLGELDDRTLRDIGVYPGEIASYWAEAEGLAQVTRRRGEALLSRL